MADELSGIETGKPDSPRRNERATGRPAQRTPSQRTNTQRDAIESNRHLERDPAGDVPLGPPEPSSSPENINIPFDEGPMDVFAPALKISAQALKILEDEKEWVDMMIRRERYSRSAQEFFEYVQGLLLAMIEALRNQSKNIQKDDMLNELRERKRIREQLEIKAALEKGELIKELIHEEHVKESHLERRLQFYLKLEENLERWNRIRQLSQKYPLNRLVGANFLFQITMKDLIMEVKGGLNPKFLKEANLNINTVQIFLGLILEMFLYSISIDKNQTLDEHLNLLINEYGKDVIDEVFYDCEKGKPLLSALLFVFASTIYLDNMNQSEEDSIKAIDHMLEQMRIPHLLDQNLLLKEVAREIVSPSEKESLAKTIKKFLISGELQGILDLQKLREIAQKEAKKLPQTMGPA